MQIARHKEIVSPFAWKGAELQDSTGWIRPFHADELTEIDAALVGVKRRGLEWLDVTRNDFPLPRFASALAGIALELETGRGMILLRGLPLHYSPDELALNMAFEPGDIQLLNNHLIYHARTRYDDYDEPEKKRLLLRLWLAVPGSRPLPAGYELVFGNIEAGAVRGGVPSRDGWRDVTQLRARRAKG